MIQCLIPNCINYNIILLASAINRESTIERTCPICKEKLPSAKEFREHMIEQHKNANVDPEFECPDCGKSFRQYSNMRRHYRIHTGETPFTCEVCGKGFIQKVALQYHMNANHQDESENIMCRICGKSFEEPGALRRHISAQHEGNGPLLTVTGVCYYVV